MSKRKRMFILVLLLLCGLMSSCSIENEMSVNTGDMKDDREAALGNRILIVYYSPNGQVREMAEIIRDYTGGILQEIKTVEVYPDNMDEFEKAILAEQKEGKRPEIVTDIKDLENYDTLLLGFPIWYGQVPMAVPAFLESFDLTGKKVVPFITGEYADLSEIQSNLAEFCKGADLEECTVIWDEEWIAAWLKQAGIFSEIIRIRAGNDILYGGLYQNQEAYEFAELLPMTVYLYIPASFARAFDLDRELSNGEYRTRTYEIGKIAYWPEGPAVACFVDDSEPQTVVPVIHLGQIFSGGSALAECEVITVERLETSEHKKID